MGMPGPTAVPITQKVHANKGKKSEIPSEAKMNYGAKGSCMRTYMHTRGK